MDETRQSIAISCFIIMSDVAYLLKMTKKKKEIDEKVKT